MSSICNTRTRNWTFIIYPESLPDNFLDLFDNLSIPCALSPLHDMDLKGTGEEKKAHYHVFLAFDSVKSYDQVADLVKIFNGTIPQMVKSSKALIRYFCHLDNPDKVQYSISDIKVFCGFDLNVFIKPTPSECALYLNEILQFIMDNDCYEYADVLNYCRLNKYNTWFLSLLNGYDNIVYRFCNSKRYKIRQTLKFVDKSTGEIVG